MTSYESEANIDRLGLPTSTVIFRPGWTHTIAVCMAIASIAGCNESASSSLESNLPPQYVPTLSSADSDSSEAGSLQTASRSSDVKLSESSSPGSAGRSWQSLFDGKSLDGWKSTEFGGEGDVLVKDGNLVLEMGADLTGVTATFAVPDCNYEVRLNAMRVGGSDFFCGLTFPVKESPCSLIIGGWGGGLCGLSSIDGMDAADNNHSSYHEFETGKWYTIRLKVTDSKIQAWIDDEQIIDFETEGRRLSIRSEVELSQPFGIASWQTTAALREIEIRKLAPEEQTAADVADD